MNNKEIKGTREWATVNVNCMIGCEYDCRYCYAKHNAVDRFGSIEYGEWTNPKVNEKSIRKGFKKYDGQVMFPTTHDITPNNLVYCEKIIEKLLKHNNNILIVSKPNKYCINSIIEKFSKYKDNILFRFTIGSFNDNILGYWEPNAPNFKSRFSSLYECYHNGWKTSISCEPMLDSLSNMIYLYKILEKYITDSMWFGKMNNIDSRVKIKTEEDSKEVTKIKEWQTNENIIAFYTIMKDEPKVKWKENIKKIVGIPLVKEAGLDV